MFNSEEGIDFASETLKIRSGADAFSTIYITFGSQVGLKEREALEVN